MYCFKCGESINERMNFCPKCGSTLNNNDAGIEQNITQDKQISAKIKAKLSAFLLWLFLGFLGGHCFYIGNKKMGIMHILLDVCIIITFIMTMVEAFLVLLSFQVILWLVGLLFIFKYFQPKKEEDDLNAVYNKKGELQKFQPFRVDFKSAFSKLLKMTIIVLIAALVINQFIGMVIIATPKPWYERLLISLRLTVAGGSAGGAIGGIIGSSIGGIGIALMGTGVGIPGAIALGVIGFLGGALTGSVATNLSNPDYYNYSIDQMKLTLLIVGAISFGFIVVSILTGLFNKLRQWLSSQPMKKT